VFLNVASAPAALRPSYTPGVRQDCISITATSGHSPPRALATTTSSTQNSEEPEILGVSPKELLWTFRLRQAAHWLRETDGTVSEIAYASGFKTVPHFTRRFKEHFGTTPAAYRRDEA